jgi:D-alanyl-lipoteichoic acid acyltransferase DltB (MBOAT superfamily)
MLASKGFLVFASLFFYSWWNIVYLPIILTSMLINYILGNSFHQKDKHKPNSKSLLFFGIVANLSLLGYFKYADFFIENVNYISGSHIELLHLALPLGISFFTFQQIAYLVDSYRKETSEYDFLTYALFVTFFPQLIAGPIVHHKEMMPQFSRLKNKFVNYQNIALGFFVFSIGLFKKVVIADSFAVFANNGFDGSEVLSMLEAWGASLSYTFQLYFDFSGYTDMAIGAALLFNIKLPINFNSPYKALDIQDFWRRWHITLSRFLRDYIYIPLGGNRKGTYRTYSNLLVTFLLGGFWHGAGWTFIFWGFMHGAGLVIHRVWQKMSLKMNTVLAWFVTFNFINISWVFFRAKEWDDAIKVLKGMFGFTTLLPCSTDKLLSLKLEAIKSIVLFDGVSKVDLVLYVFISVSTLFIIHKKNSMQMMEDFKPNIKNLLLFVFLFIVSILFLNSIKLTEFLYFDF